MEENNQQPAPQKQGGSSGLLWSVIIIIIILVGGYFLFTGNEDMDNTELEDTSEAVEEEVEELNTPPETNEVDETEPAPVSGAPNKQVVISYTDSGFDPASVEINQGDSVLFVNESSSGMWPASAMHPTHTVYPGSDIQKCFDGSDASEIFDSCGNVESYSFVFSEVGEWGYHNHSRASHFGKIIVNERPEGSL